MHGHRTETSPEAEDVPRALIRRLPPAERARKALQLTRRLIRECKLAIARNNPQRTQREIGIAFIEIHYGKKRAAAVDHYPLDRSHGSQ